MDCLLLLCCDAEERENINKRKQQQTLNIIRKTLRDTQNPFEIEENTFKKLYR